MYKARFDASIKDRSITVGYTVVSFRNRLVKELGFKTENPQIKNIQDAEGYALFMLLKYIIQIQPVGETLIIGDNKSLIDDVLSYNYDSNILKVCQIIYIMRKHKNIKLEWQPREENEYTDQIVKLAHTQRIHNNGGKLSVTL